MLPPHRIAPHDHDAKDLIASGSLAVSTRALQGTTRQSDARSVCKYKYLSICIYIELFNFIQLYIINKYKHKQKYKKKTNIKVNININKQYIYIYIYINIYIYIHTGNV